MSILIVTLSICLASIFVFIIARRFPSISNILFLAFFVRTICVLTNQYLFPLPDSDVDAIYFEARAWQLSLLSLNDFLASYPGPSPWFISWIIGFFYKYFGRNYLLAEYISVLFGIGSIILAWQISRELWNDYTAKKVAFILSIFPSSVLYSSLILRESYCSFFLLMAILFSIRYLRLKAFGYYALAILGFYLSSFFHGALMLGSILFSIYVIFDYLKLNSIRDKPKNGFLSLAASVVVISFFLSGNLVIDYIGKPSELVDKFLEKEHFFKVDASRSSEIVSGLSAHGSVDDPYRVATSYPAWIHSNNFISYILISPIRVLYFLFSPFPWDISFAKHWIGFIDGIFYLVLLGLLLTNLRSILKTSERKLLLFFVCAFIIVFSHGTSNSGTAIRHRAKLIALITILVAPRFPKISINKDFFF